MACACKNKTASKSQVTRVKQVVKSKSVVVSTAPKTIKKAKTRVIYRRSVDPRTI